MGEMMYERFTDRARKAMQLSNQEAQRCNHETIIPLHILIGLTKEGGGVASNALKVKPLENVLVAARNALPPPDVPDGEIVLGKVPLSDESTAILRRSIQTAKEWGNNWVGTEHLMAAVFDSSEVTGVLSGLGIHRDESIELMRSLVNEKHVNKYSRVIGTVKVSVDVYDIAEAYELTPALSHALKKILVAGQRGHKDRDTDLAEAIQAIERERELSR